MPAIIIDKISPPEFTSTAPQLQHVVWMLLLVEHGAQGSSRRVKLWYRVVRAQTWVMGGSEASSWFNIPP